MLLLRVYVPEIEEEETGVSIGMQVPVGNEKGRVSGDESKPRLANTFEPHQRLGW